MLISLATSESTQELPADNETLHEALEKVLLLLSIVASNFNPNGFIKS